jgi:predicted peptidase
MGGYGTWDIILRNPRLFAAAIPVCGAGDPSKAADIAHLPVWAFHGDSDPTVPVSGSRDMVEALRQADGKIQYTEYPGVGHSSWVNAWKEQSLIPWIFSQTNSLSSDERR